MNHYKSQRPQTDFLRGFYLHTSFIFGTLLWAWSSVDNGLINNFFLSTYLVGTGYFTLAHMEKNFWGHLKTKMPKLFFFQLVMLLGFSFEQHQPLAILFGLIPTLGALGHYSFSDPSSFESEAKGPYLIILFPLLYFIGSFIFKRPLHSGDELAYLGLFFLWGSILMYWGGKKVKQERQLQIINWLRKRNKRWSADESYHLDLKRESYFFHDLLNHIHGIGLFLANRLRKGDPVELEEIALLKNEVDIMESVTVLFSGHGKRSIKNKEIYVPFDRVKRTIWAVVEEYLPASEVETHFLFKGLVSDGIPSHQQNKLTINYPIFHRCFTNLVKNIFEEGSKEVEFIFDYREDGLHLEIKNKIYQLKDDRQNLVDNLKIYILGENKSVKKRESGLGLESVHALASEIGGSFTFGVIDGFWVSSLFLPAPTEEIDEISSAA